MERLRREVASLRRAAARADMERSEEFKAIRTKAESLIRRERELRALEEACRRERAAIAAQRQAENQLAGATTVDRTRPPAVLAQADAVKAMECAEEALQALDLVFAKAVLLVRSPPADSYDRILAAYGLGRRRARAAAAKAFGDWAIAALPGARCACLTALLRAAHRRRDTVNTTQMFADWRVWARDERDQRTRAEKHTESISGDACGSKAPVPPPDSVSAPTGRHGGSDVGQGKAAERGMGSFSSTDLRLLRTGCHMLGMVVQRRAAAAEYLVCRYLDRCVRRWTLNNTGDGPGPRPTSPALTTPLLLEHDEELEPEEAYETL